MEYLTILVTLLIVGHLINVAAGWSIHYILHHRILGIPFYRLHMQGHHRIDHENHYQKNLSNLLEHAVWLTMISLVCASYYLIIGGWHANFLTIQTITYTLLTYYLHLQFDKRNSWMNRFDWFKTGQYLHGVHHRFTPGNTNDEHQFARTCNYGFGGPLVGHYPDHLFGTFRRSIEELSIGNQSQNIP